MFKLLDVLFGCAHRRFTFPITVRAAKRRSEAAALTGTYVVCLDCGREFAYDWRQMKVVTSETAPDRLTEAAETVKRAA